MRWIIGWLTARHDRRESNLERQEGSIDEQWRALREELNRDRAEVRREAAAIKSRVAAMERQNEALRYAFHHVAGALIRLDPTNPALAQAEQMLARAFPLDFTLLGEDAPRNASAREDEIRS